MATLSRVLDEDVREGELYETLDERRIRCYACGHRCPIFEGQRGVCKVRFNRKGVLYVPWGYVAGAHCDPIEKKPFYHFLHCEYCQNWVTSQAMRDPRALVSRRLTSRVELVRAAKEAGAQSIISTYNEPLITAEWAVGVFQEARQAGLVTGFVSNGNATSEVLDYLHPWLDLYKVDLKSFNPKSYRKLGGRLEPVLQSIRRIHDLGMWLEVVTLVVPGFNDSDEELTRIAEFLADISVDVPWHVTAFHRDYRMIDPEDTPRTTLQRAARIGKRAGLHYVYAGNLHGMPDEFENTLCPSCNEVLVRRRGYWILENRIVPPGACPACGAVIRGRW